MRAIEKTDLKLVRGKLREADVDAWQPLATRPRAADIEAEQRAAEDAAKLAAQPSADEGEPDAERPLTANERLNQIKLERAEYDWAREKGKLIARDQVVKLLADFGHRIRSELQAHPRKMQAAMVRQIKCSRCGSAVEGKLIAIEAERYTAQLLRILADDPLGGA